MRVDTNDIKANTYYYNSSPYIPSSLIYVYAVLNYKDLGTILDIRRYDPINKIWKYKIGLHRSCIQTTDFLEVPIKNVLESRFVRCPEETKITNNKYNATSLIID